MNLSHAACVFLGFSLVFNGPLRADSALVTESYQEVLHGPHDSADYSPAPTGTKIPSGQDVRTEANARAELKLPSESITRLGPNTIYNFSADSNQVDLQSGTILFCKPKSAQNLSIRTAAVTAGITGTTGFVSVHGKTTIFGIIEGHASATADGHPFLIEAGDILEFKANGKPFKFAYDVPRFVHSSSLLKHFSSTLPNQSYIDKELADYADDVSRGFITPPSKAIDYDGDIPVLSTTAYDSAQSSQGAKGTPQAPQQTYRGYSPSGNLYH